MDKLKNLLLSEKGMRIVNLLFLAAILCRNSGFIIIAYAAWFVYLTYSIRKTSSKAMKAVYVVFSVFAAILILANIVAIILAYC